LIGTSGKKERKTFKLKNRGCCHVGQRQEEQGDRKKIGALVKPTEEELSKKSLGKISQDQKGRVGTGKRSLYNLRDRRRGEGSWFRAEHTKKVKVIMKK